MALTEAGTKLFPVVRDGLDDFATMVQIIQRDIERQPLRVTTTNAFASRWLAPRLPDWRQNHPQTKLEVIGTQAVVDLSSEVDVALRYMSRPPSGLVAHELLRDKFVLVASPALLSGESNELPISDIARHTVVETVWSSPCAPTWNRWLAIAREADPDFPEIGGGRLSFDEELNAIDALVAGQGIGICSDVLVARELKSGALVQIVDFEMPGLGLYLAYAPDHPRRMDIEKFLSWIRTFPELDSCSSQSE